MTRFELQSLVGKRVRIWLDREKNRYVEGVVKDNGTQWPYYIPDEGGKGNWVVTERRDIEVLE